MCRGPILNALYMSISEIWARYTVSKAWVGPMFLFTYYTHLVGRKGGINYVCWEPGLRVSKRQGKLPTDIVSSTTTIHLTCRTTITDQPYATSITSTQDMDIRSNAAGVTGHTPRLWVCEDVNELSKKSIINYVIWIMIILQLIFQGWSLFIFVILKI